MPQFKIFQKDVNGNLLNLFDDLDEASLKTGLSKDAIDDSIVADYSIYNDFTGEKNIWEYKYVESLSISEIPQNKPFPKTWDLVVGAFHSDLFSQEKNEHTKRFVDTVYQRAMEKENCGVVEDVGELEDYYSYFLVAVDGDKKIGSVGIMKLSDFFLLEDILTKEIHFCVKVEWRCSFTDSPEIKDYLSEKKKEGYDIRAGKYMQIELMKLMKSLLKDKSYRDKMDLNFENIDIDEFLDRITRISVFSCSMDTAFGHHTMNGAQAVSKEHRAAYVSKNKKDMDLNTVFESCIPFSIKSLSDMKLKMIYWSDKV